MTRHVFLSLASATMLAAPAVAGTPIAFERNGISYVADVSEDHGTSLIQGHEVKTGRAFVLKVRDSRVTGTYDGTSVNYAAPRAKLIRTASR